MQKKTKGIGNEGYDWTIRADETQQESQREGAFRSKVKKERRLQAAGIACRSVALGRQHLG